MWPEIRLGLLAAVLCGLVPTNASASMRVYFGTLHAYSNLSDGPADVSPREAYRIAKVAGEMDFLSLTDHAEMLSAADLRELRQAAQDATDGDFVGLFGQSCSGMDEAVNSTNIHNYPIVVPNGTGHLYRRLFEEVLPRFVTDRPQQMVVAAFNHPRRPKTDYGLASEFNGDWNAFVAAFDPLVQLIAIGTGPSDASSKSYVPEDSLRFMHSNVAVSAWLDYLSRGMHLAPQIDHGTHSPTYGFRIEGRTAVWVDGEFTRESLLDALARRHCYATEDRNLHVLAFVDGTHRPGDVVECPPKGVLSVTLHIHDPDEPEADYDIEVWSGRVATGRRARPLPQTYVLAGGGDVRIDLDAKPGTYFLVHLRQKSEASPCGHDDDVWLAPIWVSQSCADDADQDAWAFVGRKGDREYHSPHCDRIAGVDREDLEFYPVAPDGVPGHGKCTGKH